MKRLYACLDENNIVISLENLDLTGADFYEGARMYIFIGPSSGFEDNQPTIGQTYDGLINKFN